MSDISSMISNLMAEAVECDERSIKLRDAAKSLAGIASPMADAAALLDTPRRGRPPRQARLDYVERALKDIPAKASKKTGKKRKYTKRSAFWKKKK